MKTRHTMCAKLRKMVADLEKKEVPGTPRYSDEQWQSLDEGEQRRIEARIRSLHDEHCGPRVPKVRTPKPTVATTPFTGYGGGWELDDMFQ